MWAAWRNAQPLAAMDGGSVRLVGLGPVQPEAVAAQGLDGGNVAAGGTEKEIEDGDLLGGQVQASRARVTIMDSRSKTSAPQARRPVGRSKLPARRTRASSRASSSSKAKGLVRSSSAPSFRALRLPSILCSSRVFSLIQALPRSPSCSSSSTKATSQAIMSRNDARSATDNHESRSRATHPYASSFARLERLHPRDHPIILMEF